MTLNQPHRKILGILMYNYYAMKDALAIKQIKKNNDSKITTCAEALVQSLCSLGVDSIFGYPGAAVLSVYNELSKVQIKHFLVRHEQAALHAAEGYARVCGKTGVVLVTSGPGFTNTITGIANAYADSTPLVILAGDVSTNNKGGKIFQNVDIKSMVESCTKKVFMLKNKDDIKQVIMDAFQLASTNPKGPVVISLPRNLIEARYRGAKKDYSAPYATKKDFSNDINKLKEFISKSKKPLVIVGGGAIDASVEIQKFVSELKSPVVSTLMGIGIFPAENKNYLGMIGINGAYKANAALNQCDLIIALGVAFSDRSTCKNNNFASKTKIVSININKISNDFALNIQADVKNFLKSVLAKNMEYKNCNDWKNQLECLNSEDFYKEKKSTKLHSSFVLKTLSEFTKNHEPIVVTDVGQHQMLTAQFFNFNKPRKFLTSGGLGTMGFGLPASMGAYIANPKSLVLNITGDGSFQMNLQELATCREHNIPIKIIIMNNGYLGMVRQLQEKIYCNRYQVEMTNPDFTKIAEAYDLFAIRVSKQSELIPALEKAIEHNGTAIIDIMIDSFENI